MIQKPQPKPNPKELLYSEILDLFIKAGKRSVLTDDNKAVIRTLIFDKELGSSESSELLRKRVVKFIRYFNKSNKFTVSDFLQREYDPVIEVTNSGLHNNFRTVSFSFFYRKLNNTKITFDEMCNYGNSRKEVYYALYNSPELREEKFTDTSFMIPIADILPIDQLGRITRQEKIHNCICNEDDIHSCTERTEAEEIEPARNSMAKIHRLFIDQNERSNQMTGISELFNE